MVLSPPASGSANQTTVERVRTYTESSETVGTPGLMESLELLRTGSLTPSGSALAARLGNPTTAADTTRGWIDIPDGKIVEIPVTGPLFIDGRNTGYWPRGGCGCGDEAA